MQSLAKVAYFLTLIVGVVMAFPAKSDSLRQGKDAVSRGNYDQEARLFTPYARRGNARAQAMLGFMYENGLGAPQAYDAAVELYSRAAERGDPSAQYLLGLMYDKGHGVDRDEVLAYKWLSLPAASAPIPHPENYPKLPTAAPPKIPL